MSKVSVFLLSVIALAAAFAAGSCSFEAAVPKYAGNAGSPPELVGVRTSSSSEVHFLFSEPVSVVALTLDPPTELADTENGETVIVRFDPPYAAGTKVTVDMLVRDGEGNTLETLLTFTAFNDRMPVFQVTELRTEMSKPRVEFIELKMLSAGNLAGVRLFIASNGTGQPVYEFPAVDVAAGEYVLIHPRTPDYISGIDETGNDFALSASDDAKAQADCPQDVRDLWFPDNKEILRKSDAVYFMDQADNVLDAVVFCDKAKESEKWGGNPHFINAMELLSAVGAWVGGTGIDSALDSNGTSPTNTLCRRENSSDTNTADDWYQSGSGKASPGKANALP
jgi:hypothetical protein